MQSGEKLLVALMQYHGNRQNEHGMLDVVHLAHGFNSKSMIAAYDQFLYDVAIFGCRGLA